MKKTVLFYAFILALAAFGQTAWAQNYITDVMVIGDPTQSEATDRYDSFVRQGWTGINQNLNSGTEGYYIYLLYKTDISPYSSGTPITDLYLRVSNSNDAPDDLTHNGRTYQRAYCMGNPNFMTTTKGNLNCEAGGKYIHLYYTKDAFSPGRVVTSISIDNSSSNAVGENGGATPCDLNKGAGGDYIYLHVSKSLTTNDVIVVYTEAELKDALLFNNANIQLGNDIALSSTAVVENNRTMTIDLNNYTLDRGLTAQADYGQVFTVRNGSTLNLSNGTLTGGYGGNGGGIHNEGTSNLTSVIITGNTANDRGGGISNSGTLTMTDCTLSGNTSRDNLDNIGGGGLFNHPNCTATLTNVTLADNNAFYGGGLCNRGTLTMEGCTISDNLAYFYGGGIRNEGTLTMTDCTVVNNIANNDNPQFPKHGSGIWNDATLNIQGAILIKDNDYDDIYLTTDHKINVIGTLTGGPGSIGVRMKSLSGVFTEGYAAHNSETDHFFSNVGSNLVDLVNGEANLRLGYYECSWDSENKQLIHTAKAVPNGVQVHNICGDLFSSGGVLWSETGGQPNWFIADGTGETANGLSCSGSDIHLILCDEAVMTINEGLFVNEGTTLHIYCQSYGDRMGKLICIGDDSQPGIGPKNDDNGITHYSGDFDIHGGDIKATGGDYGAGIGGCEDRSSGTITIWDGKIEATGGEDAAGIGGGEGGSGTYTYIYGGNIKATGKDYGAGIGGGEYSGGGGDCGRIEIFGGTIEASGTGINALGGGAGIGTGDRGDQDYNSPIIIHGGVITATGGYLAAGIGSGFGANCRGITINGGIVMAYGGYYGAAIGGGCAFQDSGPPHGGLATITINGGFVSAYSHYSSISLAAAIGGGKQGAATVNINDGIVIACSDDGAAIGSGAEGIRSAVTITGGCVVAVALVGGAGIGGGKDLSQDEHGYITIKGGEVLAIGGAHKCLASYAITPFNPGKFIKCFYSVLLSIRASSPSGVVLDLVSTSIVQILTAISEGIEEEKYGGAGIGGAYGEENNKWDISIQGGYVVAQAGRSGAQAIGLGYDSEGQGSLDIYPGIMVSAGSDENNYTPVVAANRVSACRNNQYVYIQPCGHKDADSYIDNGNGTYSINNEEGCLYCGIEGEQTCHHTFTDDGAWNDANNWNSGHVPNDGNDVVICAHCEIPADYVAKADTIGLPYYDTIFIKEGGQLFHSNSGVKASSERTIPTYSSTNDHYSLIASPMATSIAPSDSIPTNLLANDHDLYMFDQSETLEWRNYKANQEDFSIDNGIGYLYANNGNGEPNYTINFLGELQPSKEDVSVTPYYDPNATFKGWNLVGNPFPCDAYLNDASDESMAFYRMNDDGNGFIAATGAIHQMEGIFVHATAPGQSFNFSRTQEESSKGGSLFLDLYRANTRNANVVDNVIIRFDSENTLEKFYFNDRNDKLYIPQDDKDYAVVCSDKQGTMPLNFEAKENDTYTISVKPENVEMNYLHLIDNKTGVDVDLLQTPAYTFTGMTTDYASRFRIVFSTANQDADGGNETFAFYSDGSWFIANEGDATLQVIDMMGRVLSSENIKGNCMKAINAAQGIYMLRLLNGNDMKVQKIIIK